MKILLVDDHPLILAALQATILSVRPGVQVVACSTARQAREQLLIASDYDFVLLDLQLGDADGYAVLAEFRANYPALPVVVISATTGTAT
jgi:DNA-binding NarL/FixJ family response regulator